MQKRTSRHKQVRASSKLRLFLHHRAVNVIAACRLGLNAVCMALLAFAHTEIGNPYEKVMKNAVGIAAVLFLVLGEKQTRTLPIVSPYYV